MWPHSAHLRRCNHHPPEAAHSAQPVPLGSAAGLMPSLSDFTCLAIGDARVALANFYNVAIGIANVAAGLAVFGLWLGDELGASAFPEFIAGLNIGNADIHEAADLIGIGGNAEHCLWLVGCRTAPDINDEPHVRELEVARRTLGVASAQNATTEHLLVKSKRALDVCDDHKMRDGHPILWRHLVAFLVDLDLAHG